MKKGSIFLLIMLLSITLSSCMKEKATSNEEYLEKDISTEKEVDTSIEKIVQVPEGYLLKENVYHNMEYFEDEIYAKYQWINPNDVDDWTDALWCFSPYKVGKLIAEGKGLDFRVSKNSDFIAIEVKGNIDFFDKEGEVVQTISSHMLNTEEYTNVQLEEWNDTGDILWCSLKETYDTKAYIAIDTNTWEVFKYNDRNFSSDEYVLNPNTGWIVYSDYPVMLDTIATDDYYDSKRVTVLSLYNLKTKEELDIETYETNSYRPKWSSDNEVMYYVGDRVYFYKLAEK